MEKKFAGINSIVGFVTLDDNEFNQVKIVVSKITNSKDEVSKDSVLGEALMFCEEGEVLTVQTQEPYEIKIMNIVNPVEKPGVKEIKTTPKSEPVFVDDFIPASIGNYASFKSDMSEGLEVLHAYGKVAKEVYLEGCKHFSWDYSKQGSFCSQKLLYDKDCSREGYSLWFLPYFNINNYRNDKTNWIDFVDSDFDTIKEIWKEIDERFYNDYDKRITFAKQKNGEYLYLGVFQAIESDEDARCKIFQKIEGNYY